MNGGIDIVSGKWVNIGYFPYKLIMPKKWQWHVLNMIKKFDNSKETAALVDKLWKTYKNGFVNFFKKGDVPRRSKHLVGYLSKYLFRPSISLKRIVKYDKNKETVKYKYADHRTGKTQVEDINVLEFIGKMMQQLLPKGFHRVKYYGLHHTKTFTKSRKLIIEAMKKINIDILPIDQGVLRIEKGTYRERTKLWTGPDPLTCPHCHAELELIKVWIKGKGLVFDLLEEYQNRGQPPDELLALEKVKISDPLDIVEDYFEQMNMAF